MSKCIKDSSPVSLRFWVAATLLCTPLLGQDRMESQWRIELIPGGAIATQQLAGSDLGAGGGYEVNVSHRLFRHVSSYAGWDWHRFNANIPFAGGNTSVEDSGYVFGLRFERPIRSSSRSLVLRAGGTSNHIELGDSAEKLTSNSSHGLGWDAGAGVGFRLSDRWLITPGVRFRSLSRDLRVAGVIHPATLRYVAFEVGFARSF